VWLGDLWYHQRLQLLIFTSDALSRALRTVCPLQTVTTIHV
jgi:hypothetical protein